MHIAIVSLQFEKTATGGGGVHVLNITKQFIEKNHNVSIISIHTNKTLPDVELKNDWIVPYSIEDRGKLQVIRFLIDENIDHPYEGDKDTELDRIMRFAKTAVEWLKQNIDKYDVISLHGHHIIPGWMAKQLQGLGPIVASTIHSLESTFVTATGVSFGNFEATEQMLNKLRSWEALAVYADYIVINSHKVKNQFIEIAKSQGFNPKDFEHKLVLIASGVDQDFLMDDQQIIQKLKEKPDVIKILTFSRIDPSKGHEFTILASKLTAQKLPKQKFKVYITGIPENKEYVEKLQQLAQDTPHNIEINFDFKKAISSKEEKKQIFDDKHIYILPSLQEPFGMTIIEASSRGNMVISNDTTGPMFMMNVEQEGTETKWGYITPYGVLAKRTEDPYKNLPENLSNAIIWTIENWNTGYQRVINFNKRIRQFWTWEAIANQYLKIFTSKS